MSSSDGITPGGGGSSGHGSNNNGNGKKANENKEFDWILLFFLPLGLGLLTAIIIASGCWLLKSLLIRIFIGPIRRYAPRLHNAVRSFLNSCYRQLGFEEPELMATQRDAALTDRDNLKLQLTAVMGERDALVGQRDALVGQRDAVVGERDALVGQRDAVVGERDAVVGERDALKALKKLREKLDEKENNSKDMKAKCGICGFSCPIGHGHHRYTATQPCGHIFGLSCLEEWFGTGKKTCPKCGVEAGYNIVAFDERDGSGTSAQ